MKLNFTKWVVKALKVAIQQYELPSEGEPLPAVLADVVDLGDVDTDYGKKHKAMFVYFLEEKDSQGKQKRVFERFTVSLNPKAKLYKRITGPGFNAKVDGGEIELEDFIGHQMQLVMVHSDGEGPNAGKKFANISAIMKPRLGQDVQPPEDFLRACDRPKE